MPRIPRQSGFTLAEVAIVLVVTGLLLGRGAEGTFTLEVQRGGMTLPLTAETQR